MNYGQFASADDAETFGAAALGLLSYLALLGATLLARTDSVHAVQNLIRHRSH